MRFAFLGVALLASACVSVNANVTTTPDATLLAVQNARVRECPAERVQANARTEGFGAQAGVVGEDIALTPVASDPTRAVRLRRLTIAPGGVIAWHDHTAVQGMALMVSGEMVELRNSCLDPITYRAGDIAREDAATAHSWRNETDAPAIVLVSHIVPLPR
ncbi:MAG: cupin domain-containing protein [Caulobacterales bacterium]|jgi:quercetin dioxygenase-like cupin family protein|nr:cupin domain-containing protein [Caulobacterales bacterium]